jgi:hypothetical protein
MKGENEDVRSSTEQRQTPRVRDQHTADSVCVCVCASTALALPDEPNTAAQLTHLP